MIRLSMAIAAVLLSRTSGLAQSIPLDPTSLGEVREALVIGDDNYVNPKARLKTAVNDAVAVKSALERLNFEVTLLTDATVDTLDRTLISFVAKIRKDAVVLVYFAGHGIEVDGNNYLISTDLNPRDNVDVKHRALSVAELLDRLQLSPARVKIIVLDACRNNPFRDAAGPLVGGLHAQEAAKGSYVAYSTAAGKVASDSTEEELTGKPTATPGPNDGKPGNSVFAGALVAELRTLQPGTDVNSLFNRVRSHVARVTQDQQVPYSSTGLIGEWYPFGQRQRAEPTQEEKETAAWAIGGALSLLAQGQYEDSMKKLNLALNNDWKSFDGYLYRGLIHDIKREADDAMSDFSEAIRIDGKNYVGYLNRARILAGTGHCDSAVDDYTAALQLAPDRAKLAYRGRAACLSEIGKYDEAEADMRKAEALERGQK